MRKVSIKNVGHNEVRLKDASNKIIEVEIFNKPFENKGKSHWPNEKDKGDMYDGVSSVYRMFTKNGAHKSGCQYSGAWHFEDMVYEVLDESESKKIIDAIDVYKKQCNELLHDVFSRIKQFDRMYYIDDIHTNREIKPGDIIVRFPCRFHENCISFLRVNETVDTRQEEDFYEWATTEGAENGGACAETWIHGDNIEICSDNVHYIPSTLMECYFWTDVTLKNKEIDFTKLNYDESTYIITSEFDFETLIKEINDIYQPFRDMVVNTFTKYYGKLKD